MTSPDALTPSEAALVKALVSVITREIRDEPEPVAAPKAVER